MPFAVLPLLAAGGVGFGAGFVVSDAAGKAIKLTLLGGGCYLAYRLMTTKKG